MSLSIMSIRAALLLEVMDKEPGAVALWLQALLFGTAGYLAGRYRPRWLLLVVILTGLALWNWVSELRDPFVGAAMRREAGSTYIPLGYASFAGIVLASIAGWVSRQRQYRPPAG